MRGRSITALGVVAASALTALVVSAPAAYADGPGKYSWERSCSAGGFTGTLRTTYDKGANGTERVKSYEYKIDKGSQKGGNNADIRIQDGGTAPVTILSTGTAYQDNNWRSLYLSSTGYLRGTGYESIDFVFDKSRAGDPKCSTGINW